jgi:RNA polymerase sigma-70 factor (ECF subfamily)
MIVFIFKFTFKSGICPNLTENVYHMEKDLLSKVAQGDEQAFARLFYNYKGKLFSFIFDFTRSAQKAEDILQDIFLKIWLHRLQLSNIDNFNAYLFRMAHNHAIDQLRKISRETLALNNIAVQKGIDPAEPDDVLLQKEIEEKLREAIDRLSPQQKKIYLLHREQGLKQDEIARRLQLSVSTVQNHMFSATGNIRKHLARYYPAGALCYILMAGYLLC